MRTEKRTEDTFVVVVVLSRRIAENVTIHRCPFSPILGIIPVLLRCTIEFSEKCFGCGTTGSRKEDSEDSFSALDTSNCPRAYPHTRMRLLYYASSKATHKTNVRSERELKASARCH